MGLWVRAAEPGSAPVGGRASGSVVWMRRSMSVGGWLLVGVVSAGCGGHHARVGFAACPVNAPIVAGGAPAARRRGKLSIPVAVAARVCVYEAGDHGERLERSLVLRRFAASQLRGFLSDRVTARTRGGTSCVSDPVIFALRTASGDVVQVTAAGCELASGVNTAVLTQAAGEDLSSVGGVRLDPPYRATADIMGRTLGVA
ncbi:MAG: hypothetical protein QOJ89_5269, partial [bacterium]